MPTKEIQFHNLDNTAQHLLICRFHNFVMKPNSVSLDQRFYRLFNQPRNKKLLKTVPFLLVLKNSISNLLFLRSLTFGMLFFKRNNSDIDEIWISVFLMDLASEKKVVTVKTYNTNKNITLIWAMFKQVLPCCLLGTNNQMVLLFRGYYFCQLSGPQQCLKIRADLQYLGGHNLPPWLRQGKDH